MKKLCFLTAVVLVIALLFAGCSNQADGGKTKDPAETPAGEGTSAPSAEIEEAKPVIEPEQLITKEDAEFILGEAVLEGKKTDQPVVGQKICFYDSASEDSDSYLQISINQDAFIDNDFQSTAAIYEATKAAIDETDEEREAEGIGSEYFFGTPGLHIYTEGYYLCIAAGNPDDEAVLEILKTAGHIAVSRLQEITGKTS
ncbi:MAG: hypothetical protein BWY11_01113 [Firmicutes bacterium ADurb.Bin182]|nr:MAG: hypothetical protein BWY11_01113 [Firmicutes bacterium ADurb.Bin182]